MSDLDIVNPSPGAGRRHRRVGARRHTLRGCLAVTVALAVVVGGVGVVVWTGTGVVRNLFAGPEDYRGQGSGPVTVEVLDGDSAGDIAVTLERAGVVASVDAFTDAAATDSRSLGIQPGFYRLREQMSAKAALELLVGDGARVLHQVTVPEGLTVEETVRRIADQSPVPVGQLAAAARHGAGLGLPAYARDAEGYLFPATYPLPPHTGATQVLRLMVERFDQAAEEVRLVARADDVGLDPAEVVTVASLVQAEAKRVQDLRKIAAVIYNRLDEGDRLELDSTVRFVTGGEGVFTTDKQRRSRSAYNTYRVKGLPPTPIDAPGERALRAALDPAGGGWSYFVTVDPRTGRTEFTDHYREHLRGVRQLRAYCRSSPQC